jgi:hypothetical protein
MGRKLLVVGALLLSSLWGLEVGKYSQCRVNYLIVKTPSGKLQMVKDSPSIEKKLGKLTNIQVGRFLKPITSEEIKGGVIGEYVVKIGKKEVEYFPRLQQGTISIYISPDGSVLSYDSTMPDNVAIKFFADTMVVYRCK